MSEERLSARRDRPLRAALVTALLMLIAIAATGNQYVARHVYFRHDIGYSSQVFFGVLGTWSWRLTPVSGQRMFWLGSLLGAGAMVVLSSVIVGLVVRRVGSRLASFFGAWGAVVLAGGLAGAIRGLVITDPEIGLGRAEPGSLRLTYGLLQAPGTTVSFSLGVGFVVALVAACVGGVRTAPPAVTVPAGPDRSSTATLPVWNAPESPGRPAAPWTPPASPISTAPLPTLDGS